MAHVRLSLGRQPGITLTLQLRQDCQLLERFGLMDYSLLVGIHRMCATSAPGLGSPCHICTGTGLAPATSAPGLGSPLPHLHRDLARPCHICTGTGLTPATSAPGLGS